MGREYEIEVSSETTLADQLSGTATMYPVREIVASRASVRGVIASKINDQSITTESLLEFDFCTLLEFDGNVSRYGMQPFRIKWMDAQGRRRQYTPDVLVHYAGRERMPPTVYEIKHSDDLKANWAEYKPKFKAAIAALKPIGLRFRIVTEKQIRTPRLTNARFLLQYVTPRFHGHCAAEMEMMLHMRRHLYAAKTTTPRALLKSISPSPTIQAKYLPWLWHAISYGEIGCDLDQPLTMVSPIWTHDDEISVQSTPERLAGQPWPKLPKSELAS